LFVRPAQDGGSVRVHFSMRGEHTAECAPAAARDRTDRRVLAWIDLASRNGFRRPSELTAALWQPEVMLADNPYAVTERWQLTLVERAFFFVHSASPAIQLSARTAA
jgi:hypothetical protein